MTRAKPERWYHFWSAGGDLCPRSVLLGLCGGCLGVSAHWSYRACICILLQGAAGTSRRDEIVQASDVEPFLLHLSTSILDQRAAVHAGRGRVEVHCSSLV